MATLKHKLFQPINDERTPFRTQYAQVYVWTDLVQRLQTFIGTPTCNVLGARCIGGSSVHQREPSVLQHVYAAKRPMTLIKSKHIKNVYSKCRQTKLGTY